jgi:hypothetical protein
MSRFRPQRVLRRTMIGEVPYSAVVKLLIQSFCDTAIDGDKSRLQGALTLAEFEGQSSEVIEKAKSTGEALARRLKERSS